MEVKPFSGNMKRRDLIGNGESLLFIFGISFEKPDCYLAGL
jgi:hypothetical protein